MILYFSGTGNSQFVAVEIGKKLADDEVIAINQYLKSGKRAAIHSKQPLVFVTPTYSWRIPKVVEQWIRDTTFQGNQNAYFILTCAGSCGNAAAYVEKLCAQKGLRFYGLAPVIMPENYLALFQTPGAAECREIIEKAKPAIATLAEQIQAGVKFVKPAVTLSGKLESGPINPLFYGLFVHDKGFSVTDSCISCGKCVSRCPLNNIDLVAGKPTWQGNCTHCMACIGGCPTEAILYKTKSKERHHHYIMDDSLCWAGGGQKN